MPCNALERLPEKVRVLELESGNGTDNGPVQYIGYVEFASNAALHNGDIDAFARESMSCNCKKTFEKRGQLLQGRVCVLLWSIFQTSKKYFANICSEMFQLTCFEDGPEMIWMRSRMVRICGEVKTPILLGVWSATKNCDRTDAVMAAVDPLPLDPAM